MTLTIIFVMHLIYPLSHYVSYANLSNLYWHFVLSITHNIEPKLYDEESKFACWKEAMQNKLIALDKACAWKIVDLLAHVKPIWCRWIYEIKHHEIKTILSSLTRLIALFYVGELLYFWSLSYLGSIALVPSLKFDLFWSLNFSPLHILIISVSFNSKILGFHFLLELF